MPWQQLEISTLVLVGTVLQAYLALADIAVARELRSWRDPDRGNRPCQLLRP